MKLQLIEQLVCAKCFTLVFFFIALKKKLTGEGIIPLYRQRNGDLEMLNIKQAVLGHIKLVNRVKLGNRSIWFQSLCPQKHAILTDIINKVL